MSEFEAYNREMKQWEIFPLSEYNRIRKNRGYYVPAINPEVV